MRNPLTKRLPRELKSEAGKYIIIFLFMVIMIGFVSGMTVASGSIITAYNESFTRYNTEHGNFELLLEAEDSVLEAIEQQGGVTLHSNLYKERETDAIDSTLRMFVLRETVNLPSVNEGRLPATAEEIAIDRMYACNNSIGIGDTLSVGGIELTVTGLIALPDYSTLYRSPSDMMFDAIKFGVALVTEEGFGSFDESGLHYSYSWQYSTAPENDPQAKEMSEQLLAVIAANAPVTEFIPAFSNQAIQFVGEDTGKDRMMFIVFLYVVMAIIAFVMAITTANTITKEASVIGTLRASGYTRGEVTRHYLAMPVLVTLVAAVVGNILGYTLFMDIAMDIYYMNYCLPIVEIQWSMYAFVQTTVVPVALMFFINLFIIAGRMKLSPLKLIRRDLKKNGRKKAVKLNTKIGIMHRFRIRILLQNLPNYITIIIGIFLANLIMLLGVGFSALLETNQRLVSESLICEYQYILKAPAETECSSAERYCAGSLATIEGRLASESVSVYGVEENSRYIAIGEGVYISEAFSQKHRAAIGDTITLKEEFGSKQYSFEVAGIYDSPTALALYMERSRFNEVFGYDEDYFNGWLSNEKLTDIDDMLVAAVITEDDMNKMSRQLSHSLGTVIDMFFWFGIVMFMLIVYLLSRIIIEKNAQSISMTKILGYTSSEISGLYVISTGIVVVASFVLTMPLVDFLMRYICEIVFSQFAGWLPYELPISAYISIIAGGIAAYAVIAFMQFGRVKKIPLDVALKNVE